MVKKCALRTKRFLSTNKQSRPLPATPPSLTFRAFEDKYIDFI